ncbi:hypothetical protein [Kibdelosporangium aridum]|uniref:hypothetical protein n=1 Tax=Kibdelosporangium aridum TaxID=2030 RepID=UPI00055E2162|nr:hypothetical protein [Kibdelosporangium aridum]
MLIELYDDLELNLLYDNEKEAVDVTASLRVNSECVRGALCTPPTRLVLARRRLELGLDRVEVAVPQTHELGAEAEVDFGEFYATVAGAWLKLWMFVMRLSH